MTDNRKSEILQLILDRLEIRYGICFIWLDLYRQRSITYDEMLYLEGFLNELYPAEFYTENGTRCPEHFRNGYRFPNNQERRDFLIKIKNTLSI